MYVVCVTVHVTPEHIQPFIQATLENARQSRHEPGNARFDVLQAEADPAQFFLYEVYREKDDFARHQMTPHYLRWKEAVAPWMAVPRQGVRHVSLFPEAEGWGVSRET
ncbi:MAG: antibiotic biosynthesis monooxygenase [candidate division NC10 bacterium]|nr:antibiotic biosynthesis monooxygenase [candidate division NC10 bacterium]